MMDEFRKLLEAKLRKGQEIVEINSLTEGSRCIILIETELGSIMTAPCTVGERRATNRLVHFESQSNWISSNLPVIVKKQHVTS